MGVDLARKMQPPKRENQKTRKLENDLGVPGISLDSVTKKLGGETSNIF